MFMYGFNLTRLNIICVKVDISKPISYILTDNISTLDIGDNIATTSEYFIVYKP